MSLSTTAPPALSPLSADSARTGKHPLFVKLGVILLVFWAASQLIAVLDTLPLPLQKVLMPIKAFIGPLILLFVFVGAGFRIKVLPPLLMFVVFSVLAIFNLIIRQEPNWVQAVVYAAWCGCFVITPMLLNSRERLVTYARWCLKAMLAALLFAIAIALAEGNYIYSEGGRTRYEFGTRNANYLAGFVACLVFLGLALRILSPNRDRILSSFAIISSLVVLVLTDSRTQMLLTLFVILVVWYHGSGWRSAAAKLALAIGTAALTLILALAATGLISYDAIDDYSSRRLNIWKHVINSNLVHADIVTVLWGKGHITWDVNATIRGKIDRGDTLMKQTRAAVKYKRRSFDNTYLDILVHSGLVVLFAGLLAWWRWWAWTAEVERKRPETRLIIGLIRAVIVGILASSFTAGRWPIIGHAQVPTLLMFAIGLTAVLWNESKGEVPASPTVPLPDVAPAWNPPGRLR